jgi:hypothetical protein
MDINHQKIEHFCTLFDSNFLPMGMSLHQSLMNHAQPFHLWIICMDELVEEQLKILELPQVSLIPLKEIETPELLAVKAKRGRGEYCWTITPFTFTAVFERQSNIERVTYLDADLYFFRNPQILLREFDESGRDILITEHGYAPEYDQSLLYGRFCVQFLTTKNNEEGLSIIYWWQKKCLEWCFGKLEDGKFGDQKYLDIWPVLFPQNIWILQQKENTLAPWNINHFFKYLGSTLNPVFYHFHSLRIIKPNILLLFYSYKIDKNNMIFYDKYCININKNLVLMKQYNFLIPYISLVDILGNWPIKRYIKYFLQKRIKFKVLSNYN